MKAEQQKADDASGNPPVRCRAARRTQQNAALLSELSMLHKTLKMFNITTFQPETYSCLKGNVQKPAKMTRER